MIFKTNLWDFDYLDRDKYIEELHQIIIDNIRAHMKFSTRECKYLCRFLLEPSYWKWSKYVKEKQFPIYYVKYWKDSLFIIRQFFKDKSNPKSYVIYEITKEHLCIPIIDYDKHLNILTTPSFHSNRENSLSSLLLYPKWYY